MHAYTEELFGPVGTVYRAKDADDAVRIRRRAAQEGGQVEPGAEAAGDGAREDDGTHRGIAARPV